MAKSILDVQNLGTIDAESDQKLTEYFVTTPSFKLIKGYERVVVLGRKGSGKTALFKALERLHSPENDYLVKGLSFKDYPWGAHNQVGSPLASEQEKYLHSWVFMILIETFKLMIKYKIYKKDDEAAEKIIKKVKKFITKNWGSIEFSHKKLFQDNILKCDLNLQPQAFGFSLIGLLFSGQRRESMGSRLAQLNNTLKEALLKTITPNTRVMLLFDELDLGYNPNDEDYTRRLIGLLLAVYTLDSFIKKFKLRLGSIIFLRSDIYDVLSFGDKNKITDNLVHELRWSRDLEGDTTLKRILDKRIKVEFDLPSDVDPWSYLFESKDMTGHQHKFLHMVDRTFLRPRDIVKFANLSLKKAQERIIQSGNTDTHKIINADIIAARQEFSTFLINELDDEIRPQAPSWKEYIGILRKLPSITFSRPQLFGCWYRIKPKPKGLDNAEQLISRLYHFGIIGFVKSRGGVRRGSAYYFSHINPDVKLDLGARFYKVHLGLKEYLELTR